MTRRLERLFATSGHTHRCEICERLYICRRRHMGKFRRICDHCKSEEGTKAA
jgi:hypothetical protein